jgi:hypothetical protein
MSRSEYLIEGFVHLDPLNGVVEPRVNEAVGVWQPAIDHIHPDVGLDSRRVLVIALKDLAVPVVHRDLVRAMPEQEAVDDNWPLWVPDLVDQEHPGLVVGGLRDPESAPGRVPLEAGMLDDLVDQIAIAVHVNPVGMAGMTLRTQG